MAAIIRGRSRTRASAQIGNIFIVSEEFENAGWNVVTNISARTADQAASPSGSTNADLIIASTATGLHFVRQTKTKVASAITYTFSAFVKRVSGTTTQYVYLSIYNGGADEGFARFDLTSGAVDQTGDSGTFEFISGTAVDVGDGWYRCVLTVATDASASVQGTVFIGEESQAAYNQAYIGSTATHQLYVWGAQLNRGTIPGHYVRTTDRAR